MMQITLNGINVDAEEGWTILETAKFFGINIPTLCYHEGLSSYGSCRLCIVEIGKEDKTKLVASCLYPVQEGLNIRTHSERVIKARKLLVELLVSRCPQSKILQDLASSMGIEKVRFKPKNDDCILCGLCIRMCEEQMDAKAIGFVSRGVKKRISTPFDIKSDKCRTCGACIWICPACQLRCQGPEAETVLCSGCLNISPPCVEEFDNAMCYMEPCVACFQDINKKENVKKKKIKKKEIKNVINKSK